MGVLKTGGEAPGGHILAHPRAGLVIHKALVPHHPHGCQLQASAEITQFKFFNLTCYINSESQKPTLGFHLMIQFWILRLILIKKTTPHCLSIKPLPAEILGVFGKVLIMKDWLNKQKGFFSFLGLFILSSPYFAFFDPSRIFCIHCSIHMPPKKLWFGQFHMQLLLPPHGNT